MRKKASFDVDSKMSSTWFLERWKKAGVSRRRDLLPVESSRPESQKLPIGLREECNSLCHRLQPLTDALAIDLARPVISL